MEEELAGFDTTSIAQELQCPICLDTLRDTMLVQACLHRFCSECIQKCLRTSKLECPTCRIHIPSKRSLRKDTHTDTIVNTFFPPSDRETSIIRTDIWEWRKLHEQRTASFIGASKAASGACAADSSGSASPESAGAGVGAESAAGEAAGAGPDVNGDDGSVDLSPQVKRPRHSVGAEPSGGADPEICVALRYIPDYAAYSKCRCETNEPLDQSISKKIIHLKNMYTLDFPFVRVPARTRLLDVRAFVCKMLASAGLKVDPALLLFGVLTEKDKMVSLLLNDEDLVLSLHRDYSAEYLATYFPTSVNDSSSSGSKLSPVPPVVITYSIQDVK